jgi:2,6-dihydroxypseudooxynicotine hydrolase
MDDRLREVLEIHSGRLVGDGVPFPDVLGAEQLASWDEWLPYWLGLSESYEERAVEAIEAGHSLTAGRFYWYASMACHYAQFLWFHDVAEKARAQARKVALYDAGAPFFDPPAARLSVVVEGFAVPAFLRLPTTPGPHPCVVLIGGLDSTKEESFEFEELCLARGIATCAFDGPGQGEFLTQSPLRKDFDRFTSAVVDHLEGVDAVDSSRIAVLGRSLGGYYAVRSAACDDRLVACVAWGAFFDLDAVDDLAPSAAAGFEHVSGRQGEEARQFLRTTIDLADVAGHLRVPTYVLHGKADHLIPMVHVEKLRNALPATTPVTWDLPDEGNHCCHNMFQLVRPRMVDWLADQLLPDVATN